MRHFLVLFAASYLGASLCVWWLSGFDGSMPKGVLLGTVVSVDRPKESLFQKVKVQCAVNFQDVEEAMVILSRPSIPFRAGRD